MKDTKVEDNHFIMVLAVAILISFLYFVSGGQDRPNPPTTTKQQFSEEAKFQCEYSVKMSMKEPSSAVAKVTNTVNDTNGFKFLGNVNAKNSFGVMHDVTWLCNTDAKGNIINFMLNIVPNE